jgi:sigma-E factor negative regulatory protein RseB
MRALLAAGLLLASTLTTGLALAKPETKLAAKTDTRQQAAAQQSPKDAAQVLARIQDAASKQNYQGLFTYQQGENIQASRLAHVVDADGEHERVETLDGQSRIYLRHNDDIQYLQPDRKTVRQDRRHTERFPGLVQGDPAQVLRYYNLKVLDKLSRVADRECRIVVLAPRDALRYGYRLCVDTETGLLLRTQTMDSARRIVEQVSFSSVRLGKDVDVTRADSSWDTHDWKVVDPAMKPVDMGAQGWRVAMPEGFTAVMEVAREMGPAPVASNQPASGMPRTVSQMVLSDGLAAISVFIEPYDASKHRHLPSGAIRRGAINIYGKRVADYWLTALGEVPMATLERLANAVQYAAVPKTGAKSSSGAAR